MRSTRRPKRAASATAGLVGIAGLVGSVLVSPAAPAAAAVTGHGYDVSWPQCGRALPPDGDFRIVGVTGGRPYTENRCLAEQYRWARAAPEGTAFYLNTANPGPVTTAVDWYGQRAPHPGCGPSNEPACVYNYGYNGAREAFAYAQRATGAANRHSWWLDVEVENSWSPDPALNRFSIAGASAFLRSQGVPVGVYSTRHQWGRITGGAVMADHPNWVAGARDLADATARCGPGSSFTGGPVVLVQWVQNDLDHNVACGPLPGSLVGPSRPGPSVVEVLVVSVLKQLGLA